MTDIPREPLDHEPDEPGWTLAADGKWYPPEAAAPTEPIPAVPEEPARTAVMPSVSRTTVTSVEPGPALPLWLKVFAVVAVIVLLSAIAFAIGRATDDSDDQPVVTVPTSGSSVPTTAPATTVPATRAPATPAPTTAPAPTTPPTTTPAVTTTPATPPPTTQPPATTSPPTTPTT